MFLDKQSEKINELAISKYNGKMDKYIELLPNETGLHYSELDAACRNLNELGYIQSFMRSGSQDRAASFYLTHNGLHYFEYKRKNIFYLCLKSVWMPLTVSLLTNIIISVSKWLLPLIQQWLTHTP